MKTYNLDHQFVSMSGKTITEAGSNGIPATLQSVCTFALMHPSEAEFKKLNGQEKKHRHDLAVRIKNFGSGTQLTDTDVAILKHAIGADYAMEVVAQSWAIFDCEALPEYARPIEQKRVNVAAVAAEILN